MLPQKNQLLFTGKYQRKEKKKHNRTAGKNKMKPLKEVGLGSGGVVGVRNKITFLKGFSS